jgi:hypothetical protein
MGGTMTPDLKAALKAAQPILRNYVVQLEKRNSKLQLQIAKLETDNLDKKNRIKAIEKAGPKVHVTISRFLVDPKAEGKT